MKTFERQETVDIEIENVRAAYNEGGTVACAVGQGPKAGIRISKYDGSWWDYAYRVFGVDSNDGPFEWMFGGFWTDIDNTPLGAARRIEYFLLHGVPDYTPETYEKILNS